MEKNIQSILRNETRKKILLVLIKKKEASLSNLNEVIDKSKSTLHYHLKMLIEEKLVVETREEELSGSINPIKYYSISKKENIKKILLDSFVDEEFESISSRENENLVESQLSLQDFSDADPSEKAQLITVNILKDENRFRILLYIIIFRKLSLSELSKLTGKSKSTILRYTQDLLSVKFIKEVKENRENVYISVDDINKKLLPLSMETVKNVSLKGSLAEKQEMSLMVIQLYQSTKAIMEQILTYISDYSDSLHLLLNTNQEDKALKMITEEERLSFFISFLSEKDHNRFLEIYTRFLTDLRKIINENEEEDKENKINSDRPYIFFNLLMPVKKIINLKNQKNS